MCRLFIAMFIIDLNAHYHYHALWFINNMISSHCALICFITTMYEPAIYPSSIDNNPKIQPGFGYNDDDTPVGLATQKSQPNHVKIGDVAPDFIILSCSEGETHKLSDFLGRKVMLCFYRAPHCPICVYSISRLNGRYKAISMGCQAQGNHHFSNRRLYAEDWHNKHQCSNPGLLKR